MSDKEKIVYYWFIDYLDRKVVEFFGDWMVFKCFGNSDLWFCVYVFCKNMLEILFI